MRQRMTGKHSKVAKYLDKKDRPEKLSYDNFESDFYRDQYRKMKPTNHSKEDESQR